MTRNHDLPRLPYVRPDTPSSDDAPVYLRSAIYLGAVPLVTGTSIFTAFVATRAEWLVLAGLATLIAGPGLVLAGFVSLRFHVLETRKSFGRLESAQRRRVLWVALLLLANFPAGLYCTAKGIGLVMNM